MTIPEATNPRNRRLYAAYGFEVLGAIQAGKSAPLWPMLCESRGSRRRCCG
ncbi:MAG: hypothetical protein K2X97_22265 [Mycobacteriaceae bacterium]|nr:hypothetical protein [Mycobacteriaceae bacterium]